MKEVTTKSSSGFSSTLGEKNNFLFFFVENVGNVGNVGNGI